MDRATSDNVSFLDALKRSWKDLSKVDYMNQDRAQFLVNLLLHLWIVLTFLNILYFWIIKPTMIDIVQSTINNVVETNVPPLLQSIDKNVKLKHWGNVGRAAEIIEQENQAEDYEVSLLNASVTKNAVILYVCFVIVIAFAIWYFKRVRNYDLNAKHIFIENVLIFLCIAALEMMFFYNVALKYSPVTPDTSAKAALEALKK